MVGRVNSPFPGLLNMTRNYSPITLSREWSTLGRLVAVVFCACFGATINGFFVSSFFIEHDLKRIGNVFHTCVGIADMIITAGVMPIAAMVLLSGVWDIAPVCNGLQFLTEASTYCYSMFFTLVAAETFFRVCRSRKEFEAFISMRIGLVAILVFVAGIIVAGVGTFLDLDYDYCQRLHFGNFYFRTATMIIFHGIPFILTSYTLITSSIRINQHSRLPTQYKRSFQYYRDLSMIKINIIAYFLYVLAWMPYLIIIYHFPYINESQYYQSAWIGICRPLLSSVIYGSLNRSFGRAYTNLFYYCCCKSSLSGPIPMRHRRVIECRPTEVRVHIMHHAVNVNSPQRASSSARETQDLSVSQIN